METNFGPSVQLGPLSELPASESEPLGVFFLDTGSNDLWMNKETGWTLIAQGGAAIGLDQVAYGNGGGGITSDANFTRDPVTGQVTVSDNNGVVLFVIQGDPATRRVSILDENGVPVTRVSGLQADRLVQTFNDAGSLLMQVDTKSADINNAFQYAVPANPHFYVAAAGNNGPTHSGAIGDPLATVAEALRRLKVSSWSGQPTITVADSINEGASPTWNVPQPPAGASPVLIQGTFTQVLGPTAPTGGTAGSEFTPVLGTVTSAAAGGVNAYRGMFMRFTAGPLVATRHVVDSNNGAGGFVFCGGSGVAPVAADLFVIEDVPTVTTTGNMIIDAPGGVLLDGLDVLLAGALLIVGGVVQYTALRFRAAAGSLSTVSPQAGAEFRAVGGPGVLFAKPIYPLPASVIGCGSRWDGTGSLEFNIGNVGGALKTQSNGAVFIEASSLQAIVFSSEQNVSSLHLSALNSLHACSFIMSGAKVEIFSTLMDAMLDVFASFPMLFDLASAVTIQWVAITSTVAVTGLIGFRHSFGSLTSVSGANPGGGIPLVVDQASTVSLSDQPTLTGAAPGVSDVKVGANAATTWALAFGGLTANSTDLGAASSQMCRVGP